MFAIPGIIGLVFLIYVRPQEFFGPLRAVPFLYICFGLWLFGMIIDLKVRNIKWSVTPQLPWVIVFWVYASLSAVLHGAGADKVVTTLAVCVALYVGIAHAVQSFRALRMVATSVLVVVLFVCSVGVEQGFAPNGCVVIDESLATDTATGTHDGRACETARSCYSGDAEPDAEYMCERIGLFGTTSIGRGRVRYRGTLQDPNELALAGGAGLPLAFALSKKKGGSVGHGLLVALTLAVVGFCAVLTGSRGGQLVFLAVLAVYFTKRFGVGGIALGGVLALPLLLLGGRGGEEATSSTVERVECWAEALAIWRAHPLFGVGLGRFGEYHYMTAHNSYLLTLAELGLPGMLLFSALFYLSAKIPVEVLRRFPREGQDPGLALARRWAMAFLAAFAGLAVGIFFLSFAYHYVLWIYIGLAGALYSSVRAHAPAFRVRLTLFDGLIIASGTVLMIGAVYVYTRVKLG